MIKKIFEDICIMFFLFGVAWVMCGCATIKGLADYRNKQAEKCECAPAWGQQFK